jgi:hypothetical protein
MAGFVEGEDAVYTPLTLAGEKKRGLPCTIIRLVSKHRAIVEMHETGVKREVFVVALSKFPSGSGTVKAVRK